METLRRAARLILRPRAEWDRIARESTTVDELLRRYILPLAALAPIATTIGMRTFDRTWDPVHGYLVPPQWFAMWCRRHPLPAALAAWTANIVFAGIGTALFLSART